MLPPGPTVKLESLAIYLMYVIGCSVLCKVLCDFLTIDIFTLACRK